MYYNGYDDNCWCFVFSGRVAIFVSRRTSSNRNRIVDTVELSVVRAPVTDLVTARVQQPTIDNFGVRTTNVRTVTFDFRNDYVSWQKDIVRKSLRRSVRVRVKINERHAVMLMWLRGIFYFFTPCKRDGQTFF